MHTFFEIYGIQHFNPVWFINNLSLFIPDWLAVFHLRCTTAEHFPALHQNRPLRKRFVKTECAFYLQTFYEQLTSCLDDGFIRTWRRCECRF